MGSVCSPAESAAAPEQAACALLDNQSMLLPEAPCGVDSSYTETQNSSSMFDEAAILSQLLELPEISQALSDTQFFSAISCGFDPGLEAISATVDLNFNQNFSTYPQDFAHFSDMQFNMLVNESQSSQAEAQDGTVQVKMEEDLWRRQINIIPFPYLYSTPGFWWFSQSLAGQGCSHQEQLNIPEGLLINAGGINL